VELALRVSQHSSFNVSGLRFGGGLLWRIEVAKKKTGSDAQTAETVDWEAKEKEMKVLGREAALDELAESAQASGEYDTPRQSVAILGTAETMNSAPFDDPDWEIWGTGTVMGHGVGRVDRLFELHTKERWINRVQQLNAAGVPVMMQEAFEEVEKAEVFPRDRLLAKFRPYVTNSISWMIMYAIDQGYKEIGLFGVHMATDSEYAYERPSVEYWLGYAEALGVRIWIAEGAEILTASRLYGYENRPAIYNTMMMRRKALQERIQKKQDSSNKELAELHQLRGAMMDLDYWLKQFK
jgi:hypothetical protein